MAAPTSAAESLTSFRMLDDIGRAISEATGAPFRVEDVRRVGGGSINEAWRLEGAGQCFFVKLNDASRIGMFEAEAEGLGAILATDTVRAPRPVCTGRAGGRAFLALEYLDMAGGGGDADARLGERLAAMHRHVEARHGWRRDNTIGSTPQINAPDRDWPSFYRDRRLRFQLELAARNGYRGRLQTLGERLMADMHRFFDGYAPPASLLHGDLWGGNHGALADGEPVIFDPATYYGDREADIAMTELFGGFGPGFHAAYRAAWPLDPGYAVRRNLYNLYHVLNHANLFGGGYARQAEAMMERLLAELG